MISFLTSLIKLMFSLTVCVGSNVRGLLRDLVLVGSGMSPCSSL